MRFIHTADLHLGARPDAGKNNSGNREREIWETFERLIGVCEKKQVDLLLIAGDMFHRQPLLRELKEVNYLFSKLTRTKVVMIAGNHDYMKWDSYYRTFQWNQNVYPLFGDRLQCAEFPELGTAIIGERLRIMYTRRRNRGRNRNLRFFLRMVEMKSISRSIRRVSYLLDMIILPWDIFTSREL